jgi:hypothetical protein
MMGVVCSLPLLYVTDHRPVGAMMRIIFDDDERDTRKANPPVLCNSYCQQLIAAAVGFQVRGSKSRLSRHDSSMDLQWANAARVFPTLTL